MERSQVETVPTMKSPAQLWAEEEARLLLVKENAEREAETTNRNITAESEIASKRAQAKAKAAADARAAEEARIAASATDEWFYLQSGEKKGPIKLADLKEKIADLSIIPPLKMVWTAGMNDWKPVYEVRILCEPLIIKGLPSSDDPETSDKDQSTKQVWTITIAKKDLQSTSPNLSNTTLVPDEKAGMEAKHMAIAEETTLHEAKLRAEAEVKAAQKIKAAAIAKAEAERLAVVRAEQEAKLRVIAEETKLRHAAKEKVRQEAQLRADAEIKAAEEAMAAATAEAAAERQTAARAEQKAKLLAIAEEANLRQAAEERAQYEAKLRADAEVKSTEEAKAASIIKSEAERLVIARAKQKAKLRAIIEETRLRNVAEEKARHETKLQADADARAVDKIIAIAKAEIDREITIKDQADEEAKLLAIAEEAAAIRTAAEQLAKAKVLLEAKLSAVTEEKAAEQVRMRLAAEEAEAARLATLQAKEELRQRALADEQAKREIKAKAREDARLRSIAEAKAAREAKEREAAEALAKREVKAIERQKKIKAREEAKAIEEERAKAEASLLAEIAARDAEKKAASPHETLPQFKDSVGIAKKEKLPKTSSKRVWYYTAEGERIGPVAFADLRNLVANHSLDPRRDMVWKRKTANWKPAGEIDGLFERSVITAHSSASFPRVNDTFVVPAKKLQPQLIKNSRLPGARRRSFLLASLVIPFAWHYSFIAATPFLTTQLDKAMLDKILPYEPLVPLLIFVSFFFKRLVNLGMSRWWSLAVAIPFLNLWLGHRCFACPAGYFHHRHMDGRGVFIAVIYWLIVGTSLLFLIAIIALLAGVVQSPDLQQEIRGFIRIVNRSFS